jgi:hypothetical protein
MSRDVYGKYFGLFINGCSNEAKVKQNLCTKNMYCVPCLSHAKQFLTKKHVGIINNKVRLRPALGRLISKSQEAKNQFLESPHKSSSLFRKVIQI